MPGYVIYGGTKDILDGQPFFWSNKNGWGSLSSATVFSSEEKQHLKHLPRAGSADSVWVKLPN